MNVHAAWEGVPKKLARAEEAELNCPLTGAFNQADDPVQTASDCGGEADGWPTEANAAR